MRACIGLQRGGQGTRHAAATLRELRLVRPHQLLEHLQPDIGDGWAAAAVLAVELWGQGSGPRIQGSGPRGHGSRPKVQDPGFKTRVPGFKAQVPGFRAHGPGFRTQGSELILDTRERCATQYHRGRIRATARKLTMEKAS